MANFATNVAATQLTSIDSTEQFFDAIIRMDGYLGVIVQITSNFVGSPTDDLIVSLYNRNTVSGLYNNIADYTFTIDRGTDPSRVSIEIKNLFQFRIGVKASGGTDTHTSADMNFNLWR